MDALSRMNVRTRGRRLQLAAWAASISFCSVLCVYISFDVVGMLRLGAGFSYDAASAPAYAPVLMIALVLLMPVGAHVFNGWSNRRKPIDPDLETDLTHVGGDAWRLVEEFSRVFLVSAPLLVIERSSPGGASAVRFHGFRKICISPHLLDVATRHEMEAVLAHEMSHIARNDSLVGTFLRAGTLLSILTSGATVLAVTVDLVLRLTAGTSAGLSLVPATWMVVSVMLSMAAVLCEFAAMRCQEHIADIDAATITDRPMALVAYLTRGDAATGKLFTPFCTHPSPILRCIALSRLARMPDLGRQPGGSAGIPATLPAPIPSP